MPYWNEFRVKHIVNALGIWVVGATSFLIGYAFLPLGIICFAHTAACLLGGTVMLISAFVASDEDLLG